MDYVLMDNFIFYFYRWVREFLNEENHGLDVLVDYLSFTQVVMR
jgi:hypothetical protein